jgi:cbb3-type cytochrome oxidase subunit 3
MPNSNRIRVHLGGYADPSDIKSFRESNRFWLAIVMAVIFAGTIVWAFTATGTDRWTETKALLDTVLPVETALLGSLIAFYVVEVS